ncbi:hypothetical protein J3E69DRAFT_36641 [Trichoderma sp. SZMC 28015]
MRLFQSHGKLQSSPAPAPGPSLSGLEVMFPLSACVTGSLRFSPSSSALWPEPKVSRPQPFCLFCLSSFVPTADSIGSASPKKEAVLGLGAYLLCLLCSTVPSEHCSHYDGHPTTSDGDFPDTYKHENESESERTAESYCRSFRAPNCDRIHCRRPIAQYSTGDFGSDTLATAHLVTSYFSRGVCRPFVLRSFSS